MEQKTKINAEDGKQEIVITREFDLPLELLFKAYVDSDIVEQWMRTKVLKLESKKHGSYQFETTDTHGKVVFQANGVIHEFIQDHKITRTYEIDKSPFGVQLEILKFEKLTDDTTKLTMQVIYESVEKRNHLLKQPFAYGLNMAHNRLQNIFKKLN